MERYFEGKELFGDDFSLKQINSWYIAENEAYANLGSKDQTTYYYGYHELNKVHGFDKLKNINIDNTMGFGAAWGYEFEPILSEIRSLVLVEPSENLLNKSIGSLIPKYIKPTVDGKLNVNDNEFDLITCFGTLHHIPNVSYIISELIRVLKPNGHLLIREPINSMGDWRTDRKGLTKNERGIPVSFFRNEFQKYPIKVISESYCLTMTSFLQRNFGRFFKKPLYSYRLFIILDKYLSRMMRFNVKYHATRKLERIAPSSIFYVLKKL